LVLVLALVSPFWLIRPAYEPPIEIKADGLKQMSPRLDMSFGLTPDEPIAELLSAKALASSVQAGAIVPIEICWRPVSQTEHPYSVLVHLIGPENILVANRRTYPGLGRFPTTVWEPDFSFCDLVQVRVMKDLGRTLVYKVEIALLNIETNERLQVFDSTGNPMNVLFIDNVRLVSRGPKEPYVVSVNATDSPVQLAGSDINRLWSPGEMSEFTLHWAINHTVDKDYQVFVHLRDSNSGEIVAQADGPPLDGWYPTSWWPTGEIITDERSFLLPEETPAGTYELVVGLYNLDTGQRFGTEYQLGEVEVGS
jgi:hypothetical protein